MRPKPESAIRSLKVSEWPEGDQLAWEACCRLPEGLRRGGQAAHMKQVTKDDLAQRYGQFLDYVTRTQQGLTQQDPAGFVVSTIIEGYVAELRARVGSVTLYGNIYKLRRTAELLAPGKDFTWLREIEQDLEWDMRPASKADRIVDSDRIVRAGIELMREAEENPRLSKYRRARQYRNGLMIAFLALLPLRLKNFSSLKIGMEVVQVGTSWHVVIPASETKSRRAEERRIPKLLVPFLARYMEVHRLILQPRSNGLWISTARPQWYTFMPVSIRIWRPRCCSIRTPPSRRATTTEQEERVLAEPFQRWWRVITEPNDSRFNESSRKKRQSLTAVSCPTITTFQSHGTQVHGDSYPCLLHGMTTTNAADTPKA
jgi:hypothetical protein